MKVPELEGALLDVWVARALGMENVRINYDADPESLYCFLFRPENGIASGERWAPHEDWAQGGPIIERERIELIHYGAKGFEGAPWEAQIGVDTHYIDQGIGEAMGGPAPLIAAMRAFVASKYGDIVPNEPEK